MENTVTTIKKGNYELTNFKTILVIFQLYCHD